MPVIDSNVKYLPEICTGSEVNTVDTVSNLLLPDAQLLSEHESRGHLLRFAGIRKMFNMPAVNVKQHPECGHCKLANIKAAPISRKSPKSGAAPCKPTWFTKSSTGTWPLYPMLRATPNGTMGCWWIACRISEELCF